MSSRKPLIKKYFEQELPETLPDYQVLHLLLFFIDERPGVLVMDPDEDDRKILQEFCDDFSFPYMYSEDKEFSRGDLEMGGFFIARNRERIEELEKSEGEFYGFSDSAVGEFLGYPESAIEYFVEHVGSGTIESTAKDKIEDMLGDEIPFSDARYLELVPYVPRPDVDEIKEAVNKGKRKEAAIVDFDRVHDFHVGKTILSQVFSESVY
ncbi:MAG: hypothetical protein ABEJ72_05450 [Candidatus Aenigmatarchaeota archaeon]